MTHDRQTAVSNMTVYLDGEDASAQIISRSVAKDASEQEFHPIAVGKYPKQGAYTVRRDYHGQGQGSFNT
jgi:hypothetical protein